MVDRIDDFTYLGENVVMDTKLKEPTILDELGLQEYLSRNEINGAFALAAQFPETFKKNNFRNEKAIKDLIENFPGLYRYLVNLESENNR